MAGSAAAARLRARTVLRMGILSSGCVRRATAVVRQSLAAADSLEGLVRCARSKAEGAWAGQMSPVPGRHALASARPRGGVTFRQPRRRRDRHALARQVRAVCRSALDDRRPRARWGWMAARGYSRAGFTKRRVMRSLSPIARYFSASAASWLLPGGRVHTPLGWSLVSFGLALTSLLASRVKPAAWAIAITCASPT